MTTMTTMTEIKPAIERSISHNETVTVEVNDLQIAYDCVCLDSDDCDSARSNDGSLDVWGELDGEDFRLRLVRS